MAADLVIANTLRIAKADLEAAELLEKSGNRNAAYLCEQAAEKIIRAVLTSEGKPAGIGHHLDQMVDLIPDENPLKGDLRAVEELKAYATTYRYPTSARVLPAPAPEDLRDKLEKVAHLLTTVTAKFGVVLAEANTPAKNPAPIRQR